jgi:hypothetical protein
LTDDVIDGWNEPHPVENERCGGLDDDSLNQPAGLFQRQDEEQRCYFHHVD